MVDRDWDKELAKVDRQLASLSDEALLPETRAKADAAKGAKGVRGGGTAALPADTGDVRGGTPWGVYVRLALSVALAVGIVMWPYQSRCGLGLAGYLAGVAVVTASGIWSSIWTFRHRASRSHTLSLLITLWGLILGAIEILPRLGYAKPNAQHPAAWTCPAPTPPAPTTTTPAPTTTTPTPAKPTPK
jgi:hypothetical protein